MIKAGSGDDTIVGAQNDTLLDGGIGAADVLQIGNSFNDLSNEQIDNIDTVALTAASLTVILNNQKEKMTITGFATGASTITGGENSDTITGGTGNDILTGGGGDDSLTGGTGADVFVVAATADLTAGEVVDGGANNGGVDTLRLDGAGIFGNTQLDGTLSGVEVVSLNNDTSDWRLTFADAAFTGADANGDGTADGTITVRAATALVKNVSVNASAASATSELVVVGTNLGGNDTLTGSLGADTLNGGGGNDSITGGD